MAQLLTLAADTAVGRQRVYAKQNWQNPWSYYPGLVCDAMEWNSLPNPGAASLAWKVFKGTLPHETLATYHDWQQLDRRFVKVEYLKPNAEILRWFGFIDMERQRRGDVIKIAGQKYTTGDQAIGVAGIEQVLEDTLVIDGWYKDQQLAGDIDDPGKMNTVAARISMAPTFNEDRKPNRSDVKIDGSYVFAKYSQGASYWSTRDIVEYLLKRHPPLRGDGGPLVPAGILNVNDAVLYDWDKPEIEAHGRSVWAILVELLHARRGLGAYLTAADNPQDPWTFRPFSHAMTDTVLSNENPNQKLLANTLQVQVAIDLGTANARDGRPDILTILDRRLESQFDRIVAQGARRTTCFSTYFGEGTSLSLNQWITRDWSDEELALYNAGASTAGDYPTLGKTERNERNDRARHTDALQHVFSRFKLSDDFTGFAGSTYTGADPKQLFAVFDNPLDPNKAISNWPLGWRFLRTLPFFEGENYTGTQLPKWPYQSATQAEPKRMGTMIFVSLGSAKWVRADVHGTSGAPGRDWSIEVDVEEYPPRLLLKTHNAPQHIIGQGDFVPLTDALETSPQYGWKQGDLYGTICLEESRFAEAVYPPPSPNEGLTIALKRVKYIDCGDNYRKDWVTGFTAWGVHPTTSELQFTGPFGNYVRDDENALMQIARAAWEFYRRVRVTAQIQKPGANGTLWLGMLVTKLGREGDPPSAVAELNTVVTNTSLSFPRGRAMPVQVWTTSHAEVNGMEFLR